MNESLERWDDEAPELIRAAASLYTREGPSEAQLARMLEHVDALGGAAGETVTLSRLPKSFGYKLLSGVIALATVGALFWRAPAREPRPAAVVAAAAPPASGEQTPATAQVQATPPAMADAPIARVSRSVVRAGKLGRSHDETTDPAAELALLVRARRVLAVDPARALVLTEEHSQRYRRGELSEERELLAIEALVALRRRAAAETRAAQFSRRFPGSVHIRRLAMILRDELP